MPGLYQKFLLATPALSDGATLSASSEAQTLPVSHLQRMQPTDLWVAPNVVNLKFTVHLLDPAPAWSLVSLLYANFGPSDTWRVAAAATEGGLSSPTFDTGVVSAWPVTGLDAYDFVHSLAWKDRAEWGAVAGGVGTVRTEPWLEVELFITTPKLPVGYVGDPYFQAGRLYIADPWQPPYHVDRGYRYRFVERARKERMLGGGTRVGRRARPRRAFLTVNFLSEDELLDNAYEVDRLRGASQDVLVVHDPLDTKHLHRRMLYGVLTPSDLSHGDTGIHSKRYELEELL